MTSTISPTGRIVKNVPQLQNIRVSTPESRRVIEAFQREQRAYVKPSREAE